MVDLSIVMWLFTRGMDIMSYPWFAILPLNGAEISSSNLSFSCFVNYVQDFDSLIYDYSWLFMIIYDYLWLFMIIYDYLWLFMIIYYCTATGDIPASPWEPSWCSKLPRCFSAWNPWRPCAAWAPRAACLHGNLVAGSLVVLTLSLRRANFK